MSLDLHDTARILTQRDAGASIYIRAIRLFEFQTWLLYPRSTRSNKSIQKDARVLAAIKLLEHLEHKIRAATGEQFLSLKTLAANPDYAEIFDTVITKSGGWRQIRHTWSASEFDEQIKIQLAETKTVAKFIDFSYRFGRLKDDDKRSGGITMARFVMNTAPSYGVKLGRSSLKSRWNEYSLSAGFLYLLHIQKFELKPPRITKDEFADKLLEQAADREHLIELFQSHQYLAKILKPRGYSLPAISLNVGTLRYDLSFDPFPADVEDAIKRYSKEGHAN